MKKILIIFAVSGLLSSLVMILFEFLPIPGLPGVLIYVESASYGLPGILFALAIIYTNGLNLRETKSKFLLVIFSAVSYIAAYISAFTVGFIGGLATWDRDLSTTKEMLFYVPGFLAGGFVGSVLLLIGLRILKIRFKKSKNMVFIFLGTVLGIAGLINFTGSFTYEKFTLPFVSLFIIWQVIMGSLIVKFASEQIA